MNTFSKKIWPNKTWRDLAISFSLGNLIFFKPWSDILRLNGSLPAEDWTYEALSLRPTTFAAITLDVLLLTAFFWAGLIFCRNRRPTQPKLWTAFHLFLAATCFFAFNGIRLALHLGYLSQNLGVTAWIVGIVGGLLILGWALNCNARRTVTVFRGFLHIMLPFTVVTFGNGAFNCSRLSLTSKKKINFDAENIKPTEHRRIVWWLFDEMDYRLAFEQRPAGLQLPQLDRLRNESFSAAQAFPPGAYTAVSIPAYLTGRALEKPPWIGSDRRLQVDYADAAQPEEWDLSDTVFSDFKRAGAKTAMLGWYLPFCAMLRQSADYCRRLPHYNHFKRPYSDDLLNSALNIFKDATEIRPNRAYYQIQTFRSILSQASQLANDPSYDFTFVHWPAPHAPWIYDRSQASLTAYNQKGPSGYFDNLALVDRTLGELREEMEKSGSWEKTTILLSTDHAWNSSSEYDGKSDHRIPFILKFAGTHTAYNDTQTFNAVILRQLFKAIAIGEVQDPMALAAWINKNTPSQNTHPHS